MKEKLDLDYKAKYIKIIKFSLKFSLKIKLFQKHNLINYRFNCKLCKRKELFKLHNLTEKYIFLLNKVQI
jgi:hypothetical protein